MKLYSKLPNDKGQKVHLPLVGDVEFDENGILEIENEDEAYQLVELLPGRLSISQKAAEKSSSPETETPEGRLRSLKAMRMSDLKEMAKQFPEDEWKDLTKEPLITYLAEKLNKAAEDANNGDQGGKE